MRKGKQILVIILAALMVLNMGGTWLCDTGYSYAAESNTSRKYAAIEENAEAADAPEEAPEEENPDVSPKSDTNTQSEKSDTGSNADSVSNTDQGSNSAQNAPATEVNSNEVQKVKIVQREVAAVVQEAVLYETVNNKKKDSEDLKRVNAFIKALTGGKTDLSKDSGKERKAPVEVTVSGELPEDVTAEVSYIEFADPDKEDKSSESMIMSFDLTLRDAAGNVYTPAGPLVVTIKGSDIKEAADNEKHLLVYSYEESAERSEKLSKNGSKDTYAADSLVYKENGTNDEALLYKVYDRNKEYKDNEDAVRFAEDKEGLSRVKDSKDSAVSFNYSADWDSSAAFTDDGKAADKKDETAAGRPAHFVLSVQKSAEELEKLKEEQKKEEKTAEEQKPEEEKTVPEEKAEDEKPAEQVTEEKPEASKDKKLTASDDVNYKITLEYSDEAKLPEDAKLEVKELNGREYREARRATLDKLGVDKLDFARVFDITITDSEGVECQPDVSVLVKIELLNEKDMPDDLKVFHISGKDGAEGIESIIENDTISFSTDKFSVFAIVKGHEEANDSQNGLLKNLLNLFASDGEGDGEEEQVEKIDITITADSASRKYTGEALTKDSYKITSGELAEGDSIRSIEIEGSQTNVGTSDNVASEAKIVNSEGSDVTENYNVDYVNGTLTVEPAGVTLTANSVNVPFEYDEEHPSERKVEGFTCSVDGLSFEGVTAEGVGTDPGIYDVVFDGLTLNETKDSTGNYVVTKAVNGLFMIEKKDEPFLAKELTRFAGDIAYYKIIVNPRSDVLNDGDPLTLTDTFKNQSINYGSVEVESAGNVTYDYSGYTGTFSIPDGASVIITYKTRVSGDVGDSPKFSNTAELGKINSGVFVSCESASVVTDDKVITPTGTDISGSGGNYTIDLFVYPDGHMEKGLEGAVFRLLDQNKRPVTYSSGSHAGETVTFTTDERGYSRIESSEGITIHKNTAYYLEMITAPYAIEDGDFIYYQKDDTYYSFVISDEADYSYGGIYAYVNGDVLKVRCYPEGKGVNVTKRFSGNYELTDEQKNAIRFTLQKEDLTVESNWVDVESHTYADFSYGSINFETGSPGGEDLEDNATYRVIEENALPEELEGKVEADVSVSIAYTGADGKPVQDDTNEFFVDPYGKEESSYDLTFTDSYVEHKLTLIKLDENKGSYLSGAVFEVYEAQDAGEAVAEYTTGADGKIEISMGDTGAGYRNGTLYYAVEKSAPDGYVMPEKPKKVYFYFSENGSGVPAGLPPGETATDLTTSYNTVTIPNDSDIVDVPVTAVWGLNGDEAWPDEVSYIVVGLYKSVGGAEPVPVKDLHDIPRRLSLTKDKQYDTREFRDLPALENGKTVKYSVVEEYIRGSNGEDLSSKYAGSSSISGTGWYVIKNQAAVSISVEKKWLALDGTTAVSDTSGKDPVSFDVYRTTTESESSSFTRSELTEFLNNAEKVRSGIELTYSDDWKTSVDSLQETDDQGTPYYYYVIENVPDNQEDSYTVTAASGSDPRVLTIKNKQTPITVNIKAEDLQKVYGDKDPKITFESSVMEDGSSVEVSGPDESGNYTAAVTNAQGTKNIAFTVNREPGENAGTYTVTPEGSALQEGYRVLLEPGTLTISRAAVTITAGAEKTYGDADPALVTIEGLKNGDSADALDFEVTREAGEDVGDYEIVLSGESEQDNYIITYVRTDDEGKPYTFTINRAQVTVTANDKEKKYGDEDPEFTASVVGLRNDDDPTVIAYDLTRVQGENAGEYAVTPAGDAIQGNYNVSYAAGKLTITKADLKVKLMSDIEKTYGQEDPEDWGIVFEGLQGGDGNGDLDLTIDASKRRNYTYVVTNEGASSQLLEFTAERQQGENAGEYTVTLSGPASTSNYNVTYESGKMTISKAALTVKARDMVKTHGVEDPLLVADITGWQNDDDDPENVTTTSSVSGGVVTWTYTRGTVTILTFKLQREPGEDEGGEYTITASGEEDQSNYYVEYDGGIFRISSVIDVDVTQPLIDYADYSANPEYSYKAVLNLTGTGIDKYEDDDFEEVDGYPTRIFRLGGDSGKSMETLRVPGESTLTITQLTENPDYTTTIYEDRDQYSPEQGVVYERKITTYHEVAFNHNRISLPVEARAASGQSEEGSVTLDGRKGATGIPEGDDKTRAVDGDFADEIHSMIGFNLPADRYYDYDHASLYTKAGVAVPGGSNVTKIRYNSETGEWQYSKDGTSFSNVGENTQLVLFYLPKYVCKIENEKFYSLKAAVDYAEEKGINKPIIEMLIGDYTIRSASDSVTIPSGYDVKITTASTEYEGSGTAVISRSNSFTSGHMFCNRGTLTFDNIILDGKKVEAGDAFILNETDNAVLTVDDDAVIRNTDGKNGGAIYVKNGSVSVKGTLTGNNASYGGAVYVAGGSLELGQDSNITDNTATSGGAVYVAGGTFTLSSGKGLLGNGSVSNNSAANGGVVFIEKGTVSIDGKIGVAGTGKENTANLGGAVYMTGGSLTVNGSITGSKARENGGGVYLTGGTLAVSENGSLSGNTAAGNGGAIYQSGGTVTNNGSIKDNTAANGGGIYRENGSLTVNGTISGNTASSNGGGIYSTGGTLNSAAAFTGNEASNGGAIYVSSATLNITGGSMTGNKSSVNGGALYALNTTTVIGGETVNNSPVERNKAAVNGNTATGNGGAFYMEGGRLTVMASSELNGNKADNGGAVYATSGSVELASGNLKNNEAETNGGAIYTGSASVNVKVGSGELSGNKAKTGNGGALYADSGAVNISSGTLSGNRAENGKGGAVYTGSGTVNYTGGSINGGNHAVNGAAIFTNAGIANISASITGNTASNGGAVGVGSINARLYFKGDAEVNENTMNGDESNVYLDVDSELVINANSLGSGKKIGVYVPGAVDSEQVVKHGDVTGYFGAYVSSNTNANLSTVYKNDRFSDLKVKFENNRLYWAHDLKYDIYYLKDYNSTFPPTSAYTTQSKKVCSDKFYTPRSTESDIYDMVMAMKLYEAHNDDFTRAVGADYASKAVYAYTYSDEALNNTFGNYLKTVRWDGEARKWIFVKKDGTEVPNTSKLVIFYSAPAYFTVVNNNERRLELDISELSVLGKNATEGLYGFVTAKNGATVQTLRTLTEDDLKLKAGESIKLMFPGAQGQSFVLNGSFTGEGAGPTTTVKYTFNGGSEQTITGTDVNLSQYSFNPNDEAAELIFGDSLPICKIGDVPFSTLKAAMDYAKARKTATGNDSYKIEMLVDYLVPADDVLEIPSGYNITFTTASKNAETLPYTGNGTRATLSRDTGNTGASVTAANSTLTVDNLAFDGRSLTAGGKGGAVSATNCKTVKITNCEFRGYRADNGGAVYVENRAADSSLTVEKCDFSNCQTNASVDKAGGGGIWTTARELYVRKCSFDSCACLKGNAQAGSIFHNIQANWFANSKTEISDCSFSNSYSIGGSGGTVESDAYDITIQRCSFDGSYSNKNNGNGGAINVYANNVAETDKYCILRVIDCTFENCSSKNGAAVGGAVRTTSHDLILRGCVFRNVQSVTGGAVAMTNKYANNLEIYGCSFDSCIATGNGGAVSAPVPTVTLKTDTAGQYHDGTEKDGNNHFTNCTANRGGGIDNNKDGASVTIENAGFTNCVARTSNGGALYTKAQTLSVTGASNTFTDCTSYGSGGAIYQLRNADKSSVTLKNCEFSGCEASNGGNGGGVYANARTLTIEDGTNSFTDCTAANAGGGLYHDYNGTATVTNCGFENCAAKASYGGGMYTSAHSLTISGSDSVFDGCTAQTDGGGLYHNRDANGSTFTFSDGSFKGCTAIGNNGGAVFSKAKTVTLRNGTVTENTSKAQGGGVYISPSTASFEGCTITGNTVTNNDSKGGGVYVGDGTTTYKDSTVSGCTAAYGGGWYQNKGTLYILGGSISGSAANGGGMYMNDSNTKVYHYSGTVTGTATANGGGVYKNNGTYTIGDGVYPSGDSGTAYSGASIGGVATNAGGGTTYSSTAANGGGIYQNLGTLNLNSGCSISGQAEANGGGIWNKTTVNHNGGDVTGSAANGGGVYQTDTTNGKYYFKGGTITGNASENGGAVYQNGNTFNISDSAVLGKKNTGNEAVLSFAQNGGGIFITAGTTNVSGGGSISGGNASVNGGGVYLAAGTFNLNGADASVADNNAVNGGGIYHEGGTFTFKRGNIVQNEAADNGGGVYYAGGSFSMTTENGAKECGKIGGTDENGNKADKGAGIFVANGQTASFNDWASGTMAISYNHARIEGGGIAVGGPDARLIFQNIVTVRNNTMGSNNAECNVYLDQDSNKVINNNWLSDKSYIGVYASNDQDEDHGKEGKPFATYGTGANNNQNLNSYHNDRRPYLYGTQGSSNNEVVWSNFVCKITDGDGNLLYKDANGTPAVYEELENRANSADNTRGAFHVLHANGTPNLYQKNEDGSFSQYSGEPGYQVQMLVPEYELGSTRQIKLSTNVSRKITLTTASSEPDECGFSYTGDSRFNAAIMRTTADNAMVFVGGNTNWELTLSKITLDGNQCRAIQEGAIVRVENNGKLVLDSGAVLRNGLTANKAGGAVYLDSTMNGMLVMNAGSEITGCSAGTDNGGAVCINRGTFTMNGGTVTGCSAASGGGVYINNNSVMRMNGGSISGNTATGAGGGISTVNNESRVYFKGNCTVTNNTLNGSTRCNVQLGVDSNAVINADGLDSRAEIGIYTDGNIYTNHGQKTNPFGTRSTTDDRFYCFVNDRHPELRGVMGVETDSFIRWEGSPLLRVSKNVASDLSADKDEVFIFTVQLSGIAFYTSKTYGDMTFDKYGRATVRLKHGESATARFPDEFYGQNITYTVTENMSEEQQKDFTTLAKKKNVNEDEGWETVTGVEVTGKLGENISDDSTKSSALSEAMYTNTRETGDLKISKLVVSKRQQDFNDTFDYVIRLADDSINGAYPADVSFSSINAEVGQEITFTDGVSEIIKLKHGQSLRIKRLPTDLGYEVTELLNEDQQSRIRVQVQKNGSEPVYENPPIVTGTIGERLVNETNGGILRNTYLSEAVFTNNFLDIVCKITNRSRELLSYRDASGALQEAIFTHLEDAFDQINRGNLRTEKGGSVSGQLRIEMVAKDYTMESTAILSSGKSVILSTATTEDAKYPYNNGEDDGRGNVALVTRGFTDGSMITDSGTLAIEKIILDGGSEAESALTGDGDGGIVYVASSATLAVNKTAVLRNSVVSGNGGAVSLENGAIFTLNGTIDNCSAEKGGAVYAGENFKKIDINGNITGCEAAVSGGAIYASEGTSININADAKLTGNKAAEKGGAVYSDTNLVLRGRIGGAGSGEGNTAGSEGGGIYMGSSAMFTMYAGSEISGNSAENGGGLSVWSVTRIAGGTLTSNSAIDKEGNYGNGGAVYAGNGSNVTVSGSALLSDNEAAAGGAVYAGGNLTMSGGSMTGNTATVSGGAVYVEGSKTFTMSNSSISDGNKSPEGAVSTGSDAVLAFSGNSVVRGNTSPDGTRPMNVYLGYDSNSVITSSGLGQNADIGIYVADGEPEPEGKEDRVDDPIYCDHGKSARNFGTYTGSNINSARLNKFVNDRDMSLTGMNGGRIEETESRYYITWIGKGLEFSLFEFRSEATTVPINGAAFILKNGNKQVWSGSSESGLAVIPWIGDEGSGKNGARFAPKSSYTLEETATAGDGVRPAGKWTLKIGRDNSVTWTTVPSDETDVNRTIDAALPTGASEKAYLGERFRLYNDVKPTITFNANGGILSKGDPDQHIEKVEFTNTETNHDYTINEENPRWDSHVFKYWATMKTRPTEQWLVEHGYSSLEQAGYFEYSYKEIIKFFREAGSPSAFAKGKSRGDITLYAQWDEVVCKITDRDGNLLYYNGSPAVYGTLEEGFDSFNHASKFTYKNGRTANARKIEMLVENYTLEENVSLNTGKTVMITTAPRTDTDGYAYTGQVGSVCTITRGDGLDTSMVSNNGNMTIMNISFDGGSRQIECNGGIVKNDSRSTLIISSGSTLRNSYVTGDGGAVYAGSGTTLHMSGGTVVGNKTNGGSGAGIYLAQGSTMEISGKPNFGGNGGADETLDNSGNFAVVDDINGRSVNGGKKYRKDDNGNYIARQDIYIAGYAGEEGATNAASLIVAGDITSGDGTIWVWADESPHYLSLNQFAKIKKNGSFPDLVKTLKAFRNARDDEKTANNTGEYLHGTTGDVSLCVYWSGNKGLSKVILRKVNDSYDPVDKKKFEIRRHGDNLPYKVDGVELKNLTSDGSGVFWIGMLPYGKYDIVESSPRRIFTIEIDENGLHDVNNGGKNTREIDHYK